MTLKLFCTVLLIGLTSLSFSQDIIVLKNGNEITSKVLEVSSDQIKYKKFENLEGPTYSASKSEVFMIKYKNGTKDVFNTAQDNNNTSSSPNEDAKKANALKKLESYVRSKMNRQVTELTRFSKTNGMANNVFGQSVYTVMFEVDLDFVADGWLKGNDLEGYWRNSFYVYSQEPNLSAAGEQYMYATKMYAKGTLITLGCEATLSNTDNGYEITELGIKTTQNKGNAEKKRIMNFVNDEFMSGFEMQVLDYKGNAIPVTTEKDFQRTYHVSSLGDSKFITVVFNFKFKPLPKPTNFLIKVLMNDRDFKTPGWNKEAKQTTINRPFLSVGATSYAFEQKLVLDDIHCKEFDLSIDFYYADNTTWGGGIPGLGPFRLSSNFDTKLNSFYSIGDLEVLSKFIDTTTITYAEKAYFFNKFSRTGGFMCKDKIRIEQNTKDDNILTIYRQQCDEHGVHMDETTSSYMYFKGLLFFNDVKDDYLVIIQKSDNGIRRTSYDTKKKTVIIDDIFKK